MAEVEFDNPFKLPPDDQIFLIREQERKRRAEERERVKHLRVWEKTTASSKVHKSRRPDEGEIGMGSLGPDPRGLSRSASVGSAPRDSRREKENVADFVAKKREMFLVQMSLDVKKAEILKLDEKAKQKEEALKKSQQMLDDDVSRFDVFLQNNDQRAHRAMKNAEDMSKKKQEKVQRIKILKQQLSAVQSEIAKHREQKDECMKFKNFLEKLTPQEWKDRKAEEKVQRKVQRKANWIQDKLSETRAVYNRKIEEEERKMEEREKEAKARRRQRREEEEAKEQMEARKRKLRREAEAKEREREKELEAEYEEYSSEEEIPLYFEEPKQLLDVFTSLEESNLFLIQNSQDKEEALEERQQKYDELKRHIEQKQAKMGQDIILREKQIQHEEELCEQLVQRRSHRHGGSEQEDLLRELSEQVAEVYAVCGNETEQTDKDALEMLSSIEAKLEEFLGLLDEAEDDPQLSEILKEEQHSKEKERQKKKKAKRKAAEERKQERRLKASLDRSQAPIHKKLGKQIMFRSAPLFQARREVQEDDGFEEAVNQHGMFGIWMNREGVPKGDAPSKIS